MTLTEAMAVYLTLVHKVERNEQEQKAFHAAWGVIYREGKRIAFFHGYHR